MRACAASSIFAFLLAQAAIHRGVVSVFTELVSYAQSGNKLQRRKVNKTWSGKTFFDLFVHLKKERDAILVAVADAGGTMRVNPPDYAFRGDEEVVLIATGDVEI